MTESSTVLTKAVTHHTVPEDITYVTSNTSVTDGITEENSHEAEINTTIDVTSHRITRTHNVNSSSTYTTTTDLVTSVRSEPVTDVTSHSARHTTIKAHTSTANTTPSLTTEGKFRFILYT